VVSRACEGMERSCRCTRCDWRRCSRNCDFAGELVWVNLNWPPGDVLGHDGSDFGSCLTSQSS
jgi:hypothetical protein